MHIPNKYLFLLASRDQKLQEYIKKQIFSLYSFDKKSIDNFINGIIDGNAHYVAPRFYTYTFLVGWSALILYHTRLDIKDKSYLRWIIYSYVGETAEDLIAKYL